MSSKLRWMPDWLTGPSLGQYLRVRPGEKTQIAQANASETAASEEQGLNSTKLLLKKHMVDSFFERALHHMDPEQEENSGLDDDAVPAEKPAEVASSVDAYADVVFHEPIFDAEMPLDDNFLVVDEDRYEEEEAEVALPVAPEVHELDEEDLSQGEPLFEVDETAEEDDSIFQPPPGPELLFDSEEEETPDSAAQAKEKPVGYYVFAITLGQFEFQLPGMSMDDAYPLFVFPFGSAQAVIAKVPLEVYSEHALQARLNDAAWFEQTLRKHNKILGQIQSQTSIVPMRVCTICDSMEGLEAFLNQHHDDFVSTLQLIESNRTWRFRVYCNEPRLRKLTARASNKLRAIQAEMAGKSEEEAQALYEKMEAVLEEEARSVCKACVKHSHGTLASIAVKNKVVSFPQDESGTPQKREIFRCDYLVSVLKKNAFGNELTSLIESYKALGFELEVEGPGSPAQFAGRKVLIAGESAGRKSEKEAVNASGA